MRHLLHFLEGRDSLSFNGTSFIYDGIPSEMYGLVIANFDSGKQAPANFGGKLEIHEDRILGRSTSLHYGTSANEALSFPVTFVVCKDGRTLDRYDQAAIAGWLTGHNEYKQLVICQPDMEGIYYKALITELEACEVGMRQVGFTATVSCDGPYAYRSVADTVIKCDGSVSITYRNLSNVNGYYFPHISLECTGDSVEIYNESDGSIFKLSGLPSGTRTIEIDCLNQVMTSSDGINLYQYWNADIPKCFPRFLRADNTVTVSGNCTVHIQNAFPWNVGH